jgi:hypothetical protein
LGGVVTTVEGLITKISESMMVISSCWWSVESKEFALSVVGACTGIRIFEKRKGVTRSILLDKDEAAWLLKFFHDLVTVKDRRVFWNQSVSGFPRILAQQCSNRHGFFLTIEEYEGRRRRGSALVPKGIFGEGWKRFGEELRLAFNSLHAGSTSYSKHLRKEVSQPEPKSGLRKSFAEVLRSSLPEIEEPFGPSNSTIARVPRWLAVPARAGAMSTYTDKEIPIQARAKSSEKGGRVQEISTEKSSPARDNPLRTAPVSRSDLLGKEYASSLRGRVAGSSSPTLPSASRKDHFGDSLDLRSIRKTLEKLHVEIRYCLKGFHLLEDDLLGSGPKLHGPLPKTQPKSLGLKLPRPKSSKPSSPLSARGPSESVHPSKGKAPLFFPIKKPKLLVKAKAGSVLRPIPTPAFLAGRRCFYFRCAVDTDRFWQFDVHV